MFIDELDTNISSVYLKTLMQFLLENAKGQLILTTHNLDLMEVLKREKTSINAIGFDNVLDTWVHNKTIQKARESYRITDEQKDYLRKKKSG